MAPGSLIVSFFPPFTSNPSIIHAHTQTTHMAHNNSPSQGFRVGSSAPVYIRARFDPKYGQYVILWRDVQRAFIGVSQVRHGSEVVSFLTDDDFKE